jgi:hypothetical protein
MKIKMAAPVSTTRKSDGEMYVGFFLPRCVHLPSSYPYPPLPSPVIQLGPRRQTMSRELEDEWGLGLPHRSSLKYGNWKMNTSRRLNLPSQTSRKHSKAPDPQRETASHAVSWIHLLLQKHSKVPDLKR